MLTTKMLGILFWEAYQNLLIPTIIIQTTITTITIIEITIAIIIATVATITVIITIILPLIATTLRQIDYNADLSI